MFQALIRNIIPGVALASSFIISMPETVLCDITPASFKEMPPMSEIYHPVSTTNPEAQKSFNRGLAYIFAYNHDIAFNEFEKASQLDPNLAMAFWGMALALGQNINQDVTIENEKRCYEYSQKALTLSLGASPVEQAYIKALVQRYTNDPSKNLVPLRFTYRDAMKKVSADYPADLDAACLYAESILNLDPWKYWTWDGKPKEGTLEAIDVLESVLKRDPEHIGANHFYIHAWEESPTPERALMSAFRLTKIFAESGHLLHMPCHIFILCGFYEEAINTSKNAIAADGRYINERGMDREYPLHYLPHNISVLTRVYMLSEDYENAIRTAEALNQFLGPYYPKMPTLAGYRILPMEVKLYFHRWKEILASDPPSGDNATVQSYWHFSRALAYANLGDVDGFKKEKELMLESKLKIKSDEVIAQNPATEVVDLAELLLDVTSARLQKNQAEVIADLQKAVDRQDRFNYDEPSAWFMPLRIELGKVLLGEKRYKEAEEVFRKALEHLQRNGRLLFGLSLSLKGQEREWDAYWVERETKSALKNATQPLTFESL